MRITSQAAVFGFFFLSISFAQDAIFEKSAWIGASGVKTTPVDLVVSNTGVTIRSKDKMQSVVLDLPYGSISNLGYTFIERGKAALLPVMGISALFIKGQSHWLVIESSAGAGHHPTVVRLDKTEYRAVIAALTAKSGKRVEMLAPGSTLVDPTVGSHDEDQIVPFPIDLVRAALKPAMEHCSCKVSKSKVDRLRCARPIRPPDSIGGGERVIATLEPQGQHTQVQITTEKGLFGKNWSSPVYLEMVRTLQAAH
jgi:hypothetical protein